MRILLFGAAWPLGRLIASTALQESHHVTAFVRDPARPIERHDRLKIIHGDVLDAASVAAVVPGHDMVIGALGRTKQAPAGGFHHPAVGHLAEAMKVHVVSRLVWVSAHGVGDSRGDSGLVFERVLRPLLWRAEYATRSSRRRPYGRPTWSGRSSGRPGSPMAPPPTAIVLPRGSGWSRLAFPYLSCRRRGLRDQ